MDGVKALNKIKQFHPDKNQTDIINEALQAWADKLPQQDGHEKDQQGPDKETRQRLDRIEKRLDRLEAVEFDKLTKEFLYHKTGNFISSKSLDRMSAKMKGETNKQDKS